MNLHEECLLRYLSNPNCLTSSLSSLIRANVRLAKKSGKEFVLAYGSKISYTANRLWE